MFSANERIATLKSITVGREGTLPNIVRKFDVLWNGTLSAEFFSAFNQRRYRNIFRRLPFSGKKGGSSANQQTPPEGHRRCGRGPVPAQDQNRGRGALDQT